MIHSLLSMIMREDYINRPIPVSIPGRPVTPSLDQQMNRLQHPQYVPPRPVCGASVRKGKARDFTLPCP